MAWTAPMTATDGQVFTADAFNLNVRDNFLETEVAKADQDGLVFSTKAQNSIGAFIPSYHYVGTNESTNATSFTNLGVLGPTVTVTTGRQALVSIRSALSNGAPDIDTSIGFSVSGATTIPVSSDSSAVAEGDPQGRVNRCILGMTFAVELNPGVNVFTMKYKCGSSSGIAYFSGRAISVLPM